MTSEFNSEFVKFVQEMYKTKEFIPLHAPVFSELEKEYVLDCIDSTFVSSVGKYVNDFEDRICKLTGAKHAIATMNGTAALHLALHVMGVSSNQEVITQPLTFVATTNAILYTGAKPVFTDVSRKTLGMCPDKLEEFLEENCELINNICINKSSNREIRVCVPMHTFGFSCDIEGIVKVCDQWNIQVLEDAAEALGSIANGKSLGTLGALGVFSFNGNKIVTAGGGGCVITDDDKMAEKLKYISTTAKRPHKWEYFHDELGFNYRMPNLNASLLCAQLDRLHGFLVIKSEIHKQYIDFFSKYSFGKLQTSNENESPNYWLNTLLLNSVEERDLFLQETNEFGVMTRPVWELMNELPMFKDCQCGNLENSIYLSKRIVNLPSGVPS